MRAKLQSRRGAVSLGQLCAVRAKDHRHMSEDRRIPTQSLVQQYVAGRAGQPLLCAHDVGYLHGVVVNDVGQVVSGKTVRLHHDKVVQQAWFPGHIPSYYVMDDDLRAFRGDLEAENVLFPCVHPALSLLRGELRQAEAVVAWSLLPFLLLFSHRSQPFRRTETRVRVPLRQEPVGGLPVHGKAL